MIEFNTKFFHELFKIVFRVVGFMAIVLSIAYGAMILSSREFHSRSGSLMPESDAILIGLAMVIMGFLVLYYYIKGIVFPNNSAVVPKNSIQPKNDRNDKKLVGKPVVPKNSIPIRPKKKGRGT